MKTSNTGLVAFSLPLLIAALVGGCGNEDPQREILVDFDFSRSKSERLEADIYGDDFGVHLFGDTWLKDASPGLWATGDSSHAWFRLLGRECRLEVVCSTHPDLAAAGQELSLELNGKPIAVQALQGGWEEHTIEVLLPEHMVVNGMNRIVFRSSLDLHAIGLEPESAESSRAVFLRSIEISAMLSAADREHWRSWRDGRVDKAWELMDVQGRERAGCDDLAGMPDVLFVLLDATRFDRVAAGGYERTTTPNLARLAAEAVCFTSVFSNASYTRCAVPSVLTGLPWFEHNVVRGVWEEGDALTDSAVTMAEVFGAAGYHTLGVSQNPNFSVATGTDQGFDEFYEMWKRDGYHVLDLEAPERLFSGRLADGLPHEPVFTYLHLLPPHLPYAPGPEHDLWRRDDGCGKDLVRLDDVRAIEQGGEEVPACLAERVSDLYDGNLHRIDASLGRILESWQALDRERELIIVVTSDHGEAMGEHGYYDHCTTVYDEMTQVPLIVWPESKFSGWVDRRDAFLSVEDIMPMLLNTVGLRLPEDGRWPRRFLQLLEGRREGRDHILIRTISAYHTFGVRTPERLALWDGFRKQELLDVTADSSGDELRLAEPDAYIELMSLIRGALSGGSWMNREAPSSTLSPQDEEVLKSLGYL
ncbi:MAG: sulfatase [bacterium]|nr:sulfatase [bacterium]